MGLQNHLKCLKCHEKGRNVVFKSRLVCLGARIVQFKHTSVLDVREGSPEAASVGEVQPVLPFTSQRWAEYIEKYIELKMLMLNCLALFSGKHVWGKKNLDWRQNKRVLSKKSIKISPFVVSLWMRSSVCTGIPGQIWLAILTHRWCCTGNQHQALTCQQDSGESWLRFAQGSLSPPKLKNLTHLGCELYEVPSLCVVSNISLTDSMHCVWCCLAGKTTSGFLVPTEVSFSWDLHWSETKSWFKHVSSSLITVSPY